MLLSPDECKLYFKIERALTIFVNQCLGTPSDKQNAGKWYSELSPNLRAEIHHAFADNTDLIRSFVDENPFGFSDDELEIVSSWRNFVRGSFIIYRELKTHTVFLSSDDPPIAYGVLGLTDSFEAVTRRPLPVMAETILLPFKDKIIYDGVLSPRNVVFGAGIRRSFNESYKEAKERHGVVTSLPMSKDPPAPKAEKAKSVPKPPPRDEKDEVLRVVVGLLDTFCEEHLNDEYALLCRKLAEKLGGNAHHHCSEVTRMPGPAASCERSAASIFCTTRARHRT